MTTQQRIKQLCEACGLKLNDIFILNDNSSKYFKITNNGLYQYNNGYEVWQKAFVNLDWFFNSKIVVIPYKKFKKFQYDNKYRFLE